MKAIIDGDFLSMLEGHDLCVEKALGGLFGGNRQSNAYGHSMEFAEYREYIPGDDLRDIDTNLYARFDKLFIKLFVDERQLHHKIYIDGSASMNWGKVNKGYTALRLCAALAYLAVLSSDRVSLNLMQGDKCEELCRPFTGRDSFYSAADKLNGVKFQGQTDILSAIESCEKLGYGDGISFIISDFLTDCDWKGAADRLLYNKREVCLIQILSRDEITPALSGKLNMLDSESIVEDDTRNYRADITRSSLKAYEKALAWYLNDIKSFCSSRKIRFISLCSDESVEKILFTSAVNEGLIK